MPLNNHISFLILIALMATIIIFIIARFYGKIGFSVSKHSFFKLFLVAIFIPAAGEEILFRSALIYTRHNLMLFIISSLISLGLFIGWHLIVAKLIKNSGSQIFKETWFLACATIIGAYGNLWIFLEGNLWGAILFHAIIVALWQKFLNGIIWFSERET